MTADPIAVCLACDNPIEPDDATECVIIGDFHHTHADCWIDCPACYGARSLDADEELTERLLRGEW